MSDIKRDFQAHNPRVCYIDHKYLDGGRIGFSYIFTHNGNVYGGVLVYKTINGEVDWYGGSEMYDSWSTVKQRTR